MAGFRVVVTVLALVAAMVLSAMVGRRQRSGIVILALLSFVWLTVDHEFEGAVLLKITSDNGLTVADLVGLAGLGVAAWLWFRGPSSGS